MRRIGTILLPAMTIVLITSVGVLAQDGPQKPPATDQALKLKVDEITFNLQLAKGGMLGAIVTGAPYSAVAVTETVQTLADGNRIVRRSATSVARDSHGRVRREEQADDGTVTSVTILDPVAKATYLLDPANRTAQSMPLLAGAEFKTSGGGGGGGGRGFTMQVAPVGVPEARPKTVVEAQATSAQSWVVASKVELKRPDLRRDSLGTQALEGVAAEGTRTVETIPAGQIGNERPIEIVSEQWYSRELQATLMSRHDDPRSGETLYRLTNLQRNEPDPGLFQVPAGYTVKEAMKVVRPK